ncbi:unnamed protein product [Mytilus coruscus]|uniref:DNA 3'-5' helicase n=1 Tax=Mytilus coruscus TaxID=42192 RepID=A0A6J8BK91_MYTCO|nr:unnamed protein product [Mytilus coruscus]
MADKQDRSHDSSGTHDLTIVPSITFGFVETIIKGSSQSLGIKEVSKGYKYFSEKYALPYIEEDSKCCLVINGLNAIIEEQEKRFGDRCVHITDEVVKLLEKEDSPDLMHIPKAQDTISRLKNGDLSIRFILSHPEHILQPKVKQFLMTEEWSNHITHVVIDEVHLALAWGKQEFRPAYMKIGLIKTFLKKDTKILALTATANLSAQKKITSALQMVNPAVITESPKRPNVFLEVLKRPPSTGGVNYGRMQCSKM